MMLQTVISVAFFFLAAPIARAHTIPPLNLSVTFPEPAGEQNLNRAKRVQILETMDHSSLALDELDQDRIFLRDFRDVQIRTVLDEARPAAIKNGKTILFFDTNFAPAEIIAARAAALARGEELHVYPKRTQKQQDEIEKEYRLSISLGEKIRACQSKPTNNCGHLTKELGDTRDRLDKAVAQIQRLTGPELPAIFTSLQNQGVKVSAVVFSGHSGGGMNGVNGVFGMLTADDFKAAADQHPALFADLKSILLWGCYTGTLHSLHKGWQDKFPAVQGFMGYRNRAPLGIRDSSGILLKGYLLKEAQFLKAVDTAAGHAVFRRIPLVADLDATAVKGDAYFAFDRVGKISDLLKVCDSFDKSLLTKYTCYNNAEPGCENPPADHQGPLRELYTFIQVNRHCIETLRPPPPDASSGVSPMPMIPSADVLIRLIYVDEVKRNFITHHQKHFPSFAQYASDAGYPSSLRLEAFNNSTRAEDMTWINRFFAEAARVGVRDQSILDQPHWQGPLLLHRSVMSVQMVLSRFNFAIEGHCVPFSWIEPNAKEKDTCGATDLLVRPLPPALQENLVSQYYTDLMSRWFADNDPGIQYTVPGATTFAQLKESRRSWVEANKKALDQIMDRTPTEDRRLHLYEVILQQSSQLSDDQLRQALLATLDGAIDFVEDKIQEAKLRPDGSAAWPLLETFKRGYLNDQRKLEALK